MSRKDEAKKAISTLLRAKTKDASFLLYIVLNSAKEICASSEPTKISQLLEKVKDDSEREQILQVFKNSPKLLEEVGDSSEITFEERLVSQSLEQLLKPLLRQYLLSSEQGDGLSRAFVQKKQSNVVPFVNAKVLSTSNSGNLVLVPTEDFDEDSFFTNLFLDNTISYTFSPDIPLRNASQTLTSKIMTSAYEVSEVSESHIFPTKFRITCSQLVEGPNKTCTECGRIVFFSERHRHSKLTCVHSLPPEKLTPKMVEFSHTLKSLEDAPVEESVELHSALVNLLDENGNELQEGVRAYSLTKFSSAKGRAHFVFSIRDGTPCLIRVADSNEFASSATLTSKIFVPKKEEHASFLDNMYSNISTYYSKYHGIPLTNKNKYIGELFLFITLANMLFERKFHAFIVGQSGSGKTYHSKLLLPLLTIRNKVLMGTSVTRNAFIGGQSAVKGLFKHSLFRAGYIATQNVVVCEEATNSLDTFQTSLVDKTNNLFSMMKLVDQKIDVGIQGSKEIDPMASVICIGNLEQLSLVSEYRKRVQKEYFKRAKKALPHNLPLFAPIEWYLNEYCDEYAAAAHMKVRTEYLLSEKKHPITQLPEAEQSRFTFFVLLEQKGQRKQEFIQPADLKTSTFKHIHTAECMQEISELFSESKFLTHPDERKREWYSQESLKKLKDDLFAWMKDEYFTNRNNFKPTEHFHINSHVYTRIYFAALTFIQMQKLFYSLPYEFTEEDKILLKHFLLYNYNTLDEDESSMKKKPYVNDLGTLDIDEEERKTLELNAEFVAKKKAEQEVKKMLGSLEVQTPSNSLSRVKVDELEQEIQEVESLQELMKSDREVNK